jgi:hypothetical protein
MRTLIQGKSAVWTLEIEALWEQLVVPRMSPGETISMANYYAPRPYVDEYNRGSDKEGFVYEVHGSEKASRGGHVCYAERVAGLEMLWALKEEQALKTLTDQVVFRPIEAVMVERYGEEIGHRLHATLLKIIEEINDPCVDNRRFAEETNPQEVRAYLAQKEHGCCGARDAKTTINGRTFLLGFNYGH